MNQVIERLKYEFSKGTSLIKLIYLNGGVFLFVSVLYLLLNLFDIDNSFVYKYFSLHADGVEFITKPWTILTYSVLHSGIGHLFFNMILLYFSGQIFMQYLNEKQLISIYILGVVVGGLFFVLGVNLFPLFSSPVPSYTLIGASAGAMAVLISIASYIPNYSVRLFIVGNVKLWHLALFFVFLDVLNFSRGNEGGHISHLGGAFIGYIYGKQLRKNNDIGSWLNNIVDAFIAYLDKEKTPFKKVYKNEKTPRDDYDYNFNKTKEAEQVDVILGKISKSGYESLSAKEKEFLFKTGKK